MFFHRKYSFEYPREGAPDWNMRLLVYEGIAYSVMYSMTSLFLVAFALALGASDFEIGLLSSLPTFFWTLALVPAALLTLRYAEKRKTILVSAAFLSRFSWIGAVAIALLTLPSPYSFLLVTVIIAITIGAFASPAWSAIVGDVVPDGVRGRYFGRRNALTTVSGLAAMLAAGFMLDVFGRQNLLGFVAVFSMGIIFGILSAIFFSRLSLPQVKTDFQPRKVLGFGDALANRRFRKFLFLFLFFQFAVMLASPFFDVQLLSVMKAGYIWISIKAVAAGVAGALFLKLWGKFSDDYGHRVITVISAVGISFVPLLWIPATEPWMIVPAEILGGIMWAGFGIAAFNYMLENSTRDARPAYAALFSIAFGVASIFGPVMGGYIAETYKTSALFGFEHLHAVFFVSWLLRIAAVILIWKFLEEAIEKREHVNPGYVFAQMLNYGIHGGIFRVHSAAGAVRHDFRVVEEKVGRAFSKAERQIKHAVENVERAVEEVGIKSDHAAEKVVKAEEEMKHDIEAALKKEEEETEGKRKKRDKIRVVVED